MFIDAKQSPNLEKAVFRYAINEGDLVVRNNLLPINIINMILLLPKDEEITQEYIENANIPIIDYKWMNNDVILMKIADIQERSYETLFDWFNSTTKKAKEMKIELHD